MNFFQSITYPSIVSFRSYEEIQVVQDRAAKRLSSVCGIYSSNETDFDSSLKFQEATFHVPYQKGRSTCHSEQTVWIKSLKDWILDLILDPKVQPYLQFDAYQKFRFMSNTWVRVIDEPWTGDNWAKMQVSTFSNRLTQQCLIFLVLSVNSGISAT
jgi:Plavaka transposase